MSTTIQSSGAITYRTVLMDLPRAAAFARCLDANSRFCDVTISDARGKYSKHFVSFRPTSADRQGAMYQSQMDVRQARAAEQLESFIFWPDPDKPVYWCFSDRTGNTYELTIFDCDCPDHTYRCAKAGLLCKHRFALQMQLDAGMVGKTDKTTPQATSAATETPEQRRERILANIARDF